MLRCLGIFYPSVVVERIGDKGDLGIESTNSSFIIILDEISRDDLILETAVEYYYLGLVEVGNV